MVLQKKHLKVGDCFFCKHKTSGAFCSNMKRYTPWSLTVRPWKWMGLEDDPASFWVWVTFQGVCCLNFGGIYKRRIFWGGFFQLFCPIVKEKPILNEDLDWRYWKDGSELLPANQLRAFCSLSTHYLRRGGVAPRWGSPYQLEVGWDFTSVKPIYYSAIYRDPMSLHLSLAFSGPPSSQKNELLVDGTMSWKFQKIQHLNPIAGSGILYKFQGKNL